MKTLKVLAITVTVLVVFCNTYQASAQIAWQQQYGCGSGLSCSPGAIAFDSANNKLVIIGTSFEPNDYSQGKFWLWKINPNNGNKESEVIIKDAPESIGVDLEMGDVIRGLTISSDGSIYTLGTFDNPSNLSFMKMNNIGQIVFSKIIDIDPNEQEILTNIIYLPNSNFLLIGQDSSGKGVVVKLDSSGNILWNKTYSKDQTQLFTDVTAVGTASEFLLVGCFGNSGQSPSSNIWVARCDTMGNIVTEKSFPGICFPSGMPQTCQLSSGSFVVVYNESTDIMSPNFKIKAFNSALEPSWEKQISVPTNIGDGPFRIEAIPLTDGGFVVAGCKSCANLVMNKYDKDGNDLYGISVNNVILGSNLHLKCTENKAFTVSKNLFGSINQVKIIAIDL
jgi:hypothetical protein